MVFLPCFMGHDGGSCNVTNDAFCYGDVRAVNGLSFEVYEGELFGLLGPNGAGKTTSIRIIMDIFKPDAGEVQVLGRPPGAAREQIGYLPEERGLYPDLRVMEALVYLAELKGVGRATATRNATRWLERIELSEWAHHRVKDLSRGMHQKLQIASTLVHDPSLLILDEPFQGLDPVNVDLIKRLVRDLQSEGKTIVLSAHQMNLVEALCDRIVLIDDGQAVLYGDLAEIKREHAPRAVQLRTPDRLNGLPGVARIESREGGYTLTLDGISPQGLLRMLVEQGVQVLGFEVETTPLEDIFIKVVRERDAKGLGR